MSEEPENKEEKNLKLAGMARLVATEEGMILLPETQLSVKRNR